MVGKGGSVFGWGVDDGGEDVGAVVGGVDVLESAAFDDAEHGGGPFSAVFGADEEPVFASDGDGSNGAFGGVVVHGEVAVVEEGLEGFPLVAEVGEGGSDAGVGWVEGSESLAEGVEVVDEGLEVVLALFGDEGVALVGGEGGVGFGVFEDFFVFAEDVVDVGDDVLGIFVVFGVGDEFAACVDPAADALDVGVFFENIVAGVAIADDEADEGASFPELGFVVGVGGIVGFDGYAEACANFLATAGGAVVEVDLMFGGPGP